MPNGYHHKITVNKTTYYYNENNYWHRTDGPAIEHANGDKSWYVDGVHLTEDLFNRRYPPKPIELPKVKSKYKF
jgi:hypothetical protein